ncbi:tat pathway signal sequence domain protein [Bacteroides sp. CAG:661]|nr:tat pathway signal sequence domain protein [Bacteroides sp. CAG:661]
MQNRRDFLKTAAFAALGSGMVINEALAGERKHTPWFNINKSSTTATMKLRFFPYELKLRHVFTVATYSRSTTPDVQVELEYDGVIGYGEASMPPYLQKELGTMDSVMAFLKKVQDTIGQFSDPFQMEDILAYIDGLSEGNAAAKAAVDIALHDLVGKLLQAPWYKIWGLDKAKAPSTTFTIGIDTPDVVREKTKECADQFNILKVKLGGDNDKEMIETIRSVTSLPIAVDANQGWTDRQHALDMIHWLKEQGIVMVEQPMPKAQIDDIAWITQQSPLPIFADEGVQRLKDVPALKGAYTGINIKLMKCTGMREAWKMLILARALDMKVMVGCMTETSCACSAAAQLSPAVDFADLDGNLLIANDRFSGMEVVKGKITLPDLPGIGVVINN